MGTVLGDLLQITDFQTYLSQQVLNVYYYRVTTVTPQTNDAYEIYLDHLENEIIPAVAAVQVNTLVHESLELRNLSNGIDIVSRVVGTSGALSGGSGLSTPSYVAVTFRLLRESLTTRNGYKRFGGIADGYIDGNEFTPGAGEVADIEAALAADVTSGIATIGEPVIVKRPIPSVPITSYDYSSIGEAQLVGMGTQNTRKKGRGG
uniref:Uncharacterized protein n=1 Tax=uncultured prokaryote TaxID=198431 RepID=A0A0H5Q739_9ZZZZ|nr:hypothetical protein [uncultured prokaryote]